MDEFDEICRRCTPVVYRFLLSLCKDASLADELTAETFYQAYLHIGTFRGDCRVESWLCQIAKNALSKELRRRKRAVPYEETRELAAADDIFELLADKELAMRIHASLHRLKEPYREVFTLRVLGELHFRDIADLFGKSESWAKVTFCRVIGDLLPLYADESCSGASRALVDEHLKTCPRCRETLARMKSEQFLPAAQTIAPPAVADYAQKVKQRRQKRGACLTVGVIALIVLLSLTVAAWMNLVRAQTSDSHSENGVYDLAADEITTTTDESDTYRLCTNTTKIRVALRSETPQSGTITLWNITDVANPYPAMFYEVDGRTARCDFTNLSSAERYFVLCDGLSGDVILSDGRPTDLWESFLDLLHTLFSR